MPLLLFILVCVEFKILENLIFSLCKFYFENDLADHTRCDIFSSSTLVSHTTILRRLFRSSAFTPRGFKQGGILWVLTKR